MSAKRLLLTGLVVLSIACASGTPRPADATAPGVDVRLLNELFFGSNRTAAGTFEVEITNNAAVPMLIHSIRLSSPGMLEYSLRPEERRFGETIEAGVSKAFSVGATVVAASAGTDHREPLTVRVQLDVESGGKRYREIRNVMNVGM